MMSTEEQKTLDGHTLADDVRCVKCGNPPRTKLPSWARPGAVFAAKGRVYRIVTGRCSTNEGTHQNAHHRDYVRAYPVKGGAWKFPDTPTTKAAIAEALDSLHSLPRFFAADLESVIYIEPPVRS
jgi:hypothetical protein